MDKNENFIIRFSGTVFMIGILWFAGADVRVSKAFSDHTVLQRDMKVRSGGTLLLVKK
jgi:hypothetical protein